MALYKVDSDTADLTKVAGGTLYADNPIGSILPYGGAVAPSGWFICQGQAISRTTYAELFAVIGTAFGTGDGSTTFNLPDLREATTKGVGLSGKSNNHYDSNGIALGEFVEDRVQAHTHSHKTGSSTAGSEEWVMFATSQVISGICQTDYGIDGRFGNTTEVKAVGVNYIIKAKHVPVPADFSESLIGYLGKETNYNLYSWSHVKSNEGEDISQDITIERDGWYSIDYTLSSNADTNHTFTLRDFDSQGEVHTIMRTHYDKSGTFRQTYLVPLKAGTYRYSHGGTGTLSVYMNRRDFAY